MEKESQSGEGHPLQLPHGCHCATDSAIPFCSHCQLTLGCSLLTWSIVPVARPKVIQSNEAPHRRWLKRRVGSRVLTHKQAVYHPRSHSQGPGGRAAAPRLPRLLHQSCTPAAGLAALRSASTQNSSGTPSTLCIQASCTRNKALVSQHLLIKVFAMQTVLIKTSSKEVQISTPTMPPEAPLRHAPRLPFLCGRARAPAAGAQQHPSLTRTPPASLQPTGALPRGSRRPAPSALWDSPAKARFHSSSSKPHLKFCPVYWRPSWPPVTISPQDKRAAGAMELAASTGKPLRAQTGTSWGLARRSEAHC